MKQLICLDHQSPYCPPDTCHWCKKSQGALLARLFKRPIIWIKQELQRAVNLGQNRLLRFNRWRQSLGITTSVGSNGRIE